MILETFSSLSYYLLHTNNTENVSYLHMQFSAERWLAGWLSESRELLMSLR